MGRTGGRSSELAKSALSKIRYQVGRYGPTMSQKEMKHVIGQLDQNIDWEKPGMQAMNDALTSLRTHYDSILKSANPDYANAMKPVSDGMRLFSDTKKLFNIESVPGQGYKITNATISSLKNLLGKTRGVSQEVAEKLKLATWHDFVKMADDAAIASEFTGGKTQGSRRVNLGAILGSTLGSGVGGVIGGFPGAAVGGGAGMVTAGIIGAYLDTAGGKAAAALIDAYNAMPKPTSEIKQAILAAVKAAVYEFREFAEKSVGEKIPAMAGAQ